jgi:hypothetical protein
MIQRPRETAVKNLNIANLFENGFMTVQIVLEKSLIQIFYNGLVVSVNAHSKMTAIIVAFVWF